MKEKQETTPNSDRTLSFEQVINLTPKDLKIVIHQCQFISDPDWIYPTAQYLLRNLVRMIEQHDLDYQSLKQDIDDHELMIYTVIRSITV